RRAPRRAARAGAPRPAAPRRSRGGGRSPRAPSGPLRRWAPRSPRLFYPRSEAAFGELDVDLSARLDRRARADDRAFAADDRVAPLQGRVRREGAEPAGRVLEAGKAALGEEPRSPLEPLVRALGCPPLAVERASRAALEP